jgi:hypothetical protein
MTSFAVDRTELKKLFATTENALNWAGYFLPFGANLRAMVGTLQIAGGLFMAGKGACSALFLNQEEREVAFRAAYKDLIFVVHGAANKVRSEVERQLFFPLSLALAVWDFSGMRIKYSVEKEASGQDLTMEMVADDVRWIRGKVDRILGLLGSKLPSEVD